MFSFTQLLLVRGYYFAIFYLLAVGLGFPIPADPVLLIAGALAGDHHYSLVAMFFCALIPSLTADYIWYEVGRAKGNSVLRLLCKLTIEPDTCVRTAESNFTRRGVSTLYFAKFVPGASLISMPMAGVIGMPRRRFLLADSIGCALWVATYMGTGFIFHKYVDSLVSQLGLFGQRAGMVALTLLALFIGFKYLQRWRILHELRVNRISPQTLSELLEAKDNSFTVVDLRHPNEVKRDAFKIPGALVLRPEEIRARAHEIPQGQEIILYCT